MIHRTSSYIVDVLGPSATPVDIQFAGVAWHRFSGPLQELTPPQITANQNNYTPTGLTNAEWLRLSSDAARDITGLGVSGIGVAVKHIFNVGAFNITLKYLNAGSIALCQFRFSTGADIVVVPDDSVSIWWDRVTQKWRNVK